MANEHTVTNTAGAPRRSVSTSAGSRQSMRGRRRMPTFLSAGIWKAICMKTPRGLPMAMARKARF